MRKSETIFRVISLVATVAIGVTGIIIEKRKKFVLSDIDKIDIANRVIEGIEDKDVNKLDV